MEGAEEGVLHGAEEGENSRTRRCRKRAPCPASSRGRDGAWR